jgi:MBG domain-containing protein
VSRIMETTRFYKLDGDSMGRLGQCPTNPTFTGTITGLQNGDNITATYSTNAVPSSSIGSYAITPTLVDPGGKLGNYAVTVNNGTLTVGTAPLTITVTSVTKILDAPNPALNNVSYSGFLLSDGPGSLGGTPSCTTTATATSPVGSYPITCAGLTSSNYAISYKAGTLKILYAPAGGMCAGDVGHTILQPINADGTSVWKQGATIPVKFRVCDAKGVSIGTPGVVSSFRQTGIYKGTLTSVDESVTSTNSDTAFRWDSTGQQWIFNLSTSGLLVGNTYVYTITLNDGTIVTGTTDAGAGNASFQFGLK